MEPKLVFNATITLIGSVLLLIHIINLLIKKEKRKDEYALFIFFLFTMIHFAVYFSFTMIKLVYTSDLFIKAFYTAFFIMNNLEVYFFYRYLSSYITLSKSVKKRIDIINIVLLSLFVLSDIINFFVPIYFSSNNGVYTRSRYMFFSQGYQFVMLAICLILALSNKHLILREKAAFSVYVFLPAISIIIQNLMPGYVIAYATLLIAIELLFVFLSVERNIQLKEEEKLLEEANTRIMVSQIQPHFVYNTLSTISTLIELNPSEARKALDDFTEYLRMNFSSLTSTKMIPFTDELRHIETYIQLEKLRFGERLKFVKEIKTNAFMLPALSIQPLVENAIKHGIMKKLEGGTVTLRTYEENHAVVIEVIDDGVGVDFSTIDFKNNKHVALNNINKRIVGNKLGQFNIESKPGYGTKATLKLYR